MAKYVRISGVIQTGISFFAGSIVLLVVLLCLGTDISMAFEPTEISVLLYLALFVTRLGYLFYFKAIEKGGAISGSFAFFIKPILTPFVTFLVNGIIPDSKVFVAVVLVVAASYFSTRNVKSPAEQLTK